MGLEFIKKYGQNHHKKSFKMRSYKKMTVSEYKMNNKLGRVRKGKQFLKRHTANGIHKINEITFSDEKVFL